MSKSIRVSLRLFIPLFIIAVSALALFYAGSLRNNISAAGPEARIQLSEFSCGTNAGSVVSTTSGWSSYATDSNGYDADCAKVYLSGLTETTDFRLGLQLADGSATACSAEIGTQQYTPWASTGGGYSPWASDSDKYDPNCVRIYIETRTAPAGARITNPQVAIEASDAACSSQLASSTFSPTAGGYTSWVSDSNGYDYDCLRLNLKVTVVPAGNVIVSTQAFDKNGNVIAYKPAVSWTMSVPSGASSCNGTNSTGKTCTGMPYGSYDINPTTSSVINNGITYEFIGVSPGTPQTLGDTSPDVGACASGQTNPYLAYNASGVCARVYACGVTECSLGGAGGGGGGLDRQVMNPAPKAFSLSTFFKNIFMREAEARIACDIDGTCTDEPVGPTLPTPDPPNTTPPAPKEIFFVLQYKEVPAYTLAVTKTGTGTSCTISSSPTGISCGSDCSEAYASDTSVTLTKSGTDIIEWSGACTGTASSCGPIIMSGDKTVSAKCTPAPAVPIVSNPSSSSVTTSSATISGRLDSIGSPAPADHGFCWGTSNPAPSPAAYPNSPGAGCEQAGTKSDSSLLPMTISKSLTGLTSGTTYYYRYYARNATGTSSVTGSFATQAGLVMTGSITVPNCSIALGAGSCTSSASWSVTNPVASPTAITAIGMSNINVSTATGAGTYNGTQTVTVPYSSRTFRLYNNGQELASDGASASCATGTDWSTLSDTCVQYKDLTAATPPLSQNSATINVPRTFTSVISNGGNIATGAGFPAIFQTSTVSNFSANVTDYRVSPDMSALNAGTNATATSPNITFVSAGTMYVRACADKTSAVGGGVITESDPGSEGNNCSGARAVSVTGPTAPDLTADDPTPATATPNQATQFSSTIRNTGTASATGTIKHLFQFDADADHDTAVTAVVEATTATPINASGGTAGVSASYNFPTAGTWYARVCADRDASDIGTVAESDEIDNCSNWVSVVVSTGPIPVVSISANPTSGTVNVVNPSLTWSATNTPTSCTASGDWSGAKAVSGTSVPQGVLTEVRMYTYTLVCTNANGTSAPASATVDVTAAPVGIDLTAGMPWPYNAQVNVNQTFSASIKNNGTSPASGSISHIFQYDEDSNHNTGVTNVAVSTTSTIAGNGDSVVINNIHKFTSTGQKFVRVCADANASGPSDTGATGTVTEIVENNNCSSQWTSVTVSTDPPPPCPDCGDGDGDGTAINGDWSGWFNEAGYPDGQAPAGTCSAQCGGGVQGRTCTSPPPQNGGQSCLKLDGVTYSLEEYRECNTGACDPDIVIDGKCFATHYFCEQGTVPANSKVNGSKSWTWTCTGINNGASDSCEELKKKPTFQEN